MSLIVTRLAATSAALAAAFFMMVAAGVASAQPLDRGDPAAVAEAFLAAYQRRQLEALPNLVNAKNRPVFDAMAAQGASHPAYSRVFSGWRAEVVDAWDGQLGPLRESGGEILAPFLEISADEIAVVVLQNEDGLWLVEDVNSPQRTDFEALPPVQ